MTTTDVEREARAVAHGLVTDAMCNPFRAEGHSFACNAVARYIEGRLARDARHAAEVAALRGALEEACEAIDETSGMKDGSPLHHRWVGWTVLVDGKRVPVTAGGWQCRCEHCRGSTTDGGYCDACKGHADGGKP